MVDWSLARQIARFAAGGGGQGTIDADFDALVADANGPLRDYTGLEPANPVPPPEVVDRAEWADVNLTSLCKMLGPVSDRLASRLEMAGPLAGPLRAVTGATLAAESGLVMGYMSQRVLGQYELSLIQPEAPARLLFVGPNVERAVAEMAVERDSFLKWLALH